MACEPVVLAGGAMNYCRSCEATIRWVTMAGSGKAMPLDAVPTDAGTIEVTGEPGAETGAVVGQGERLFPVALYVSHYATCPDADKWRK